MRPRVVMKYWAIQINKLWVFHFHFLNVLAVIFGCNFHSSSKKWKLLLFQSHSSKLLFFFPWMKWWPWSVSTSPNPIKPLSILFPIVVKNGSNSYRLNRVSNERCSLVREVSTYHLGNFKNMLLYFCMVLVLKINSKG